MQTPTPLSFMAQLLGDVWQFLNFGIRLDGPGSLKLTIWMIVLIGIMVASIIVMLKTETSGKP